MAAEAAALRLIDAPLHRDQARKLVSRLREGMAPARPPSDSIAAARAALTALATGQPAEAVAAAFRQHLHAIPDSLLRAVLAEPDGEPAASLPHVPLSKYAAAVERERQAQQAEQRWLHRMAHLRDLLAPLPAAVVGRVQAAQARLAEASGQQPAEGAEGAGQAAAPEEAPAGPAPPASATPTPSPAAPANGADQQSDGGDLPAVAVLTLTGPIHLGTEPSRTSPPLGGASPDAIASLPVIKALRAARQDPAVKACVLRVDSPGVGVWGAWPGVALSVRPPDACPHLMLAPPVSSPLHCLPACPALPCLQAAPPPPPRPSTARCRWWWGRASLWWCPWETWRPAVSMRAGGGACLPALWPLPPLLHPPPAPPCSCV